MNRLRKIAGWFWLGKERMVLAIMVVFLCFRVYQIIYPEEGPVGDKIFQPPRSELSELVDIPGVPPRTPISDPPESWRGLWTRPPFIYVRPGDSSRSSGSNEAEIDLELLNMQEAPDGSYRVRIRSASTRKWYSEGDAFEAYELLSIDPEAKCCVIFSEELDRRVEICIDQ